MSKTTGRTLIAVIVVLLVSNWFYARKAKAGPAQPQIEYGQPACKSYVPISWGEYVGAAKDYGVVFKDNAGTLRFVNNVPCEAIPLVSLEIRRGNPPR